MSACAAAQVIVYLATGAGKTLIAVLLTKHILDSQSRDGLCTDGTVVFLAPTVLLVSQQAAYFAAHLSTWRVSECVAAWVA